MLFEVNVVIWGFFFVVLNVYYDVEFGERVLNQLIKLELNNSGNYMFLVNLYVDLGKWEEFRMMRKMMKGIGVKKMVGESFIVVENRVYRFIFGDFLYFYVVKIYEFL